MLIHTRTWTRIYRRSSGRFVPKEVRDAVAAGTKVVSGDWVRQCYVQKLRLDERNYPHTLPLRWVVGSTRLVRAQGLRDGERLVAVYAYNRAACVIFGLIC